MSKGLLKWKNGDEYEGHFVNDKRKGYGVFRWRDTRVYAGNWMDDERSGYGILTYNKGGK